MSEPITATIAHDLRRRKIPFAANDNIAAHITPFTLNLIEREVEQKFQGVLDSLLIDWPSDHNTQGTAKRVAKMFCREVFAGRFQQPPKLTDFPNAKNLDEIYLSGPITVRSTCSHHFCPILGKCWIGILPGKRVVGLSKFNRVVDWICSRPQIQEEMAVQLADYLESAIKPKGLAVVMQATHTCMTWRGVKEGGGCAMTNSIMRGVFRKNAAARAEFFQLIRL